MDNSHLNTQSPSVLIEKEKPFISPDASIASSSRSGKMATNEGCFCEDETLNRLFNKLLSEFSEVEDQYKSITHRLYDHQQEGDLTKGRLLNETLNALNQLKETKQGKRLSTFWRILLHEDQFGQLIESDGVTVVNKETQISHVDKNYIIRLLHSAARKILDKNGVLAGKLSREIVARDQAELKQTWGLITTIRQLCLRHVAIKPGKEVYMVLEGAPFIFLPMDRKLAKSWKTPSLSVNLQHNDLAIQDLKELAFITNKEVIDKTVLVRNVWEVMGYQSEVTLKEVVDAKAISNGLSELLGYVNLLPGWDRHRVNAKAVESILFDKENQKYLELPQIVFVK